MMSRIQANVVKQYDAIVIGVGAMGSAACYHLAKRGAKVLGLERFDIPHSLGSSGGHTRMTRMAYYEHPDYVPLLRRANELWRELESETQLQLLNHVGGLYMGRADGEVISGSRRSVSEHGLPHEVLTREQLQKRFPQFHLPDDHVGLLERDAGYLFPERCIAAHAHAAMLRGAEIHGREQVIEWQPGRVRTDRAEYHADKIIFCGGAWSGQLLSDLGINLRITRQVLAWFWPRKPELFQSMPVWGIERDEGLYYGFPMLAEHPGLKVALHRPGEDVQPDTVDREIRDADIAGLREFVAQHLPDGVGPLVSAKVCLYTNSPDGHFMIDHHPQNANVLIACGFSGHGFKFASVIGEVLAEMAQQGTTRHPTDFLKITRF